MTTIAIVGAGRGLGAASARRFEREGFDVALFSRSREHVDALAGELTGEGLAARGYPADVPRRRLARGRPRAGRRGIGTDRGAAVQPAAAAGVPAPGAGDHPGPDRVAALLPDGVTPLVVLAVGRRDHTVELPQPFAGREAAVRDRLPVAAPQLPIDPPPAVPAAA